MAVRKGVPDDFNERDFIDLFRNDPKATIFQTENKGEQVESMPPKEHPKPPKPPKQERRGKRSRMEEYLSLFLNFKDGLTNRFSKGKTIFISPEHHNKIQQIVSVAAGKEITITNYVDNILIHHLSHYEAEISEIYNSKNQFSQTHTKWY